MYIIIMHVYVEACNGDHYLGRYEARTNNVNIGISIHFGIITSEPEAIYVTYIPFKAMRDRIQLSLSLIFVEKWSHLPTNIGLLRPNSIWSINFFIQGLVEWVDVTSSNQS